MAKAPEADTAYLAENNVPDLIDRMVMSLCVEKPTNVAAHLRSFLSIKIKKACICGGGNGAHVFAAIMASRGVKVNIYTPLQKEVEQWNDAGLEVCAIFTDGTTARGKVNCVTADPKKAAEDVDFAIVCLPTSLHEQTISAFAPHMRPGAAIGTIEGGWWGKPPLPGMEPLTFFVFMTLPWAARIKEYGKTVEVLGTKDVMALASSPSTEAVGLCEALKQTIGINMKPSPNLLGLCALDATNIIHPGILYGRLYNWTGTPFDEAPLFYQGVDDFTESMMLKMEADCLRVKDRVKQMYPDVDLSAVQGTMSWLLEAYADQISDKSCLKRCFNTNKAYQGLKFPMKPAPSGKGLVPDFTYRYMTADVPVHLMIIRGIAELFNVPTPDLDVVLIWAQKQLNQEWLVNGRLTGKDLDKTRVPQKFGLKTLEALMESAK